MFVRWKFAKQSCIDMAYNFTNLEDTIIYKHTYQTAPKDAVI